MMILDNPTLNAADLATSRIGSAARSAMWMLLMALAYALGAYLSRAVVFGDGYRGLLWVSNAVLVAALILAPRRSWPLLLAVAAVAHVLSMSGYNTAWKMAWQIAVFFSFALGVADAMRRWIGVPMRLERGRDVLVYAGIALAFPNLLALVSPAFVLSSIGLERYFSPGIAFLRLAVANMTPLLVVTPAIVLCAHLRPGALNGISRRRQIEAAVVIGSVVIASVVAFTAGPELAQFPWLLLLTFPPLIWAAVRLGPSGASASLFCIAAFSICGATWRLGPFVGIPDGALSLQIYWIVIAPPVMLLAATIRERETAEASLHDQRSQLAQMMRMATAGEFSTELAHELRQPMQSILANAQAGLKLLENGATEAPWLREILEDIVSQDQQASKVVARLRAAVQPSPSKLEPIALEPVVRDALALTRHTAEHACVEVQAQIPPMLPPVRADRVQLLQVLVNLVVNSCESMTRMSSADRVLELRVDQAEPGRLEVSVADSGVGLPAGEQDQVFEPFFTTKNAGLGLGLSISRSIAMAHGGRLWAENNESRRGATFHLELPIELTKSA